MTNFRSAVWYLLVGIIATEAAARDEKEFFGRSTPPPSLAQFWHPIDESWWQPGGPNEKLARYCKNFAAQTSPERLLPDVVQDLTQHPSEVRWFVYMAS